MTLSQGQLSKWQLSKCTISQAEPSKSTFKVRLVLLRRPMLSAAARIDLGSCHLKIVHLERCHLGKYLCAVSSHLGIDSLAQN